jgi:hypothetical protein
MSDNTEALLIGQVQNLTAKVDELLDRVPEHGRVWITPTELSKLAGCSARTIANWRTKGKFRDCSMRPGGRNVLYHNVNALADIQGGTN